MLNKAINGKILNVDLSSGALEPESLPEEMYRRYIGGCGLGARLLFDRILHGADALGPDNVRMAFHVREGDNPAQHRIPGRLVDSPPQEAGPHKDFTLDGDTMQREFLAACDWDQQTCMPSRAKLEELGLEDVAQALHG